MRNLLLSLAVGGIFVIEFPCAPGDHRLSAEVHFQNRRFDRALTEAKRALRQNGPNTSLYLISALACVELNKVEEAYRQLGNALELGSARRAAHSALRQVTQELDRHDLAAEILRRHLDRQPDDAAGQASLGWIYSETGREEEGVRLLEAVVEDDGEEIFGHLQLSRLHLKNGEVEKAIAVLGRALEIAPENVQLLLTVGECQLESGDSADAAENFEQALRSSDSPSRSAAQIARSYYGRGFRREAISYYEQAIEADGRNLLVMNNLAWTYAEAGIELDRAQTLSLQTVKADDDNVVYLDTYAEVLYRKGETARAVAVMRQALVIEGESGQQFSYLQDQMAKFRSEPADLLRGS
jgi:tetratricopeptide (TPR) repeat protein